MLTSCWWKIRFCLENDISIYTDHDSVSKPQAGKNSHPCGHPYVVCVIDAKAWGGVMFIAFHNVPPVPSR